MVARARMVGRWKEARVETGTVLRVRENKFLVEGLHSPRKRQTF